MKKVCITRSLNKMEGIKISVDGINVFIKIVSRRGNNYSYLIEAPDIVEVSRTDSKGNVQNKVQNDITKEEN